MKWIYNNNGSMKGQPIGEVFRVEAPTAQEADVLFLRHFGFKNFNDKQASNVGMYSPEQPVNGGGS